MCPTLLRVSRARTRGYRGRGGRDWSLADECGKGMCEWGGTKAALTLLGRGGGGGGRMRVCVVVGVGGDGGEGG